MPYVPEGTKFVTLDGTERTLTGQDLMICDGEGPLGIGGPSSLLGIPRIALTECPQAPAGTNLNLTTWSPSPGGCSRRLSPRGTYPRKM